MAELAPVAAQDLPSSDADRKHKCTHCTKTFTRSEHLLRHILTHSKEKSHTCSHAGCGKTFARADTLLRHTRSHHGNAVKEVSADVSKEKSHTCSHAGCGKTFARADSLLRHTRSRHGNAVKEVSADVSTKKTSKSLLSSSEAISQPGCRVPAMEATPLLSPSEKVSQPGVPALPANTSDDRGKKSAPTSSRRLTLAFSMLALSSERSDWSIDEESSEAEIVPKEEASVASTFGPARIGQYMKTYDTVRETNNRMMPGYVEFDGQTCFCGEVCAGVKALVEHIRKCHYETRHHCFLQDHGPKFSCDYRAAQHYNAHIRPDTGRKKNYAALGKEFGHSKLQEKAAESSAKRKRQQKNKHLPRTAKQNELRNKAKAKATALLKAEREKNGQGSASHSKV